MYYYSYTTRKYQTEMNSRNTKMRTTVIISVLLLLCRYCGSYLHRNSYSHRGVNHSYLSSSFTKFASLFDEHDKSSNNGCKKNNVISKAFIGVLVAGTVCLGTDISSQAAIMPSRAITSGIPKAVDMVSGRRKVNINTIEEIVQSTQSKGWELARQKRTTAGK